MAIAQWFSYNGIQITLTSTVTWNQEVVYDDTGTDYRHTKITLGIKGMLNRAIQPSQGNTDTPAIQITRIRKALMTPRQTLSYSVGNTVIFFDPGAADAEDVFHGPKPKSLNVLRIEGTSTFLIQYEVECFLYECVAGTTLPYVSNRWKESHMLDEHGYTKRTIAGQVYFNGNYVDGKTTAPAGRPPADYYRGLIAPPSLQLLKGFRRISQDYVETEDGLALQYTVVDQEEYTMPPNLCSKFEASHTTTTTKAGGVWAQSFTVRGYGGMSTTKSQLLASVISLAQQTLDLGKANVKISKAYYKYHLHENLVEVSFETFVGGRPATVQSLNMPMAVHANPNLVNNYTKMDYLAGTRNLQPPNFGLRGTANLKMSVMQAYLGMCSNSSTKMELSIR